jgi:hypothetical protein
MRRFLLATMVLLGTVGSAQADVTYQYVTDQSNYNAAAGASVTVYFFLQENLTNGSQSIINNDSSGPFSGLYGAGFLASKNSGSTNGDATFKAGSLAFNTNSPSSGSPPGFTTSGNNSNVPNTTTQQGGLVNIGNASAGPLATNISSINGVQLAGTITNAIYLGSATVIAGSAGSTTTFTLDSYKNFTGKEGNTITSNSGFDLDVSNNSNNGGGATYNGADNNPFTFSVTVAAVPEPSSMALCGMLVVGGAFSVYRRRKAQAQTAETVV